MQEFTLYFDQLVQIWERQTVTVEANSIDEAIKAAEAKMQEGWPRPI